MGVYDMTIYGTFDVQNFSRLFLVTKWLDCLISDTPNVATMLHFDQSKWNVTETCHRAVDVVGIATIEFTKHYTHPIYGEYDLKYYWTGKQISDPHQGGNHFVCVFTHSGCSI